MAADPSHTPAPPAVLERLAARGVVLPAPQQVFVAADVDAGAIAAGAVLGPGCRLAGPETRVDAGAVIGAAGPVTLENAWVGAGARLGTLGPVTLRESVAGPGTVLGCGVAEQAVFLGKEVDDPDFTCGYGFRVRKGSLYEEDANSAQHTDTKMTVLFPWVTLGSNLNWCDILVAGGSGPGLGEFSEIGSGAVHFNFTPRGDKATGSVLGDVPEGVFLRAPRLFIGGNASLVGPVRAAYGAMSLAGGRFTRDLAAGLNVGDGAPAPGAAAAFHPEVYGSVRRVALSQLRFVGELAALDAWYAHVRERLARGDDDRRALYARGRAMVALNLGERIRHLGALAARMERSAALIERRDPGDPRIAQQRALLAAWPRLEAHLRGYAAHQSEPPGRFLQALDDAAAAAAGEGPFAYTRVLARFSAEAVGEGRAWLEAIAGRVGDPALLADVPALPATRSVR